MGSRALRAARPDPNCQLNMAEVYSIVARFGVDDWLTAADVTEYCRSRHPEHTGITTSRVITLLGALTSRRRIHTRHDSTEQRWAMPTTTLPEIPHD